MLDLDLKPLRKWDEYFFNMLPAVASKSKDKSVKVGSIIVGENDNILSTGFNGFPRGVDDNVEERYERPAKYMYTEHAERNAIYNAARHGIALDRSRIYIDWYPCTDCARAIIQSGIIEIVIDGRDYEEKEKFWAERWGDMITVSRIMLEESGVFVTIYKGEE